jgi:hypothetical protein
VGRGGGGGSGAAAKEDGNRGPDVEGILGRAVDGDSDLTGDEMAVVFLIGATAWAPSLDGSDEGLPLPIGAAGSWFEC